MNKTKHISKILWIALIVLSVSLFGSLVFNSPSYGLLSSLLFILIIALLIITGSILSVVMANRITKSDNSLKSKIYFSFIYNFFVFGVIILVSVLYVSFNFFFVETQMITALVVFVSTITFFVGLAIFIVELILSIIRSKRKDFEYDLRKSFKIINIIVIIVISSIIIGEMASSQIDTNKYKAELKSANVDMYSSNESTAMNAVEISANAETNIPVLINKMLEIANNKSLSIGVRLTALEVLTPRVAKMNLSEKKMLSVGLTKLNTTNGTSGADKERMDLRIKSLQDVLPKK